MSKQEENLVPILMEHYQFGTDDNDQRRLRENGWNDTVKAYFGKLPDDWPYLAQVVDPRIRTTIQEKNARLFNGKLRGRLVPREDGDELKAKINNAILEYQWDSANYGGSMLEKWALMDIQTRLFGASFALTYWRTEVDKDGKVLFDGNEMKVLDNRDVFVDYTANHVKNANWVQVREWKTLQQLKDEDATSQEPIYKNLKQLEKALKDAQGDRRSTEYESVVKELRGLEDRVGQDKAFPTFEVVTEYRKDRIIKFVPRTMTIIQDTDNIYSHGQIPIVQLRYYPVGDDIYGDSEVESVISIWRGIQALICGAIDEVNLRNKPPIKVANNSEVRLDTIEYGPNAVWLVGGSVNNVVELQSAGDLIPNFQTMYGALVTAYNNAMGEMSQGTGVSDPFNPDKTATEVRSSERQMLSRDQQNQLYLEQALKDQMQLWVANNKQFMFSDPLKSIIPLRILGKDIIKDLRQSGLAGETTDGDMLEALRDVIVENAGDISDSEIQMLLSESKSYQYPIIKNQDADTDEIEIRPKLDEGEDSATLYVVPEDLMGEFDYIPTVQSMSLNANEERKTGRQKSLELLLRPDVAQQLQMLGENVDLKELLVEVLEDNGIKDANKFFTQPNATGGAGIAPNGLNPAINQAGGMALPTPANIGAGETPVPQPQGF